MLAAASGHAGLIAKIFFQNVGSVKKGLPVIVSEQPLKINGPGQRSRDGSFGLPRRGLLP